MYPYAEQVKQDFENISYSMSYDILVSDQFGVAQKRPRLFFKIKGRIKKILNKFLKNDCSIGWIYWAPNFISVAKIEKRKHEDIKRITGNIIILSYIVLQFINRYVNKNNELFFSYQNFHINNITIKVFSLRN